MRAALTTGPAKVEIVDIDSPTRRPGEVVVRVQLSTISQKDASWFRAPQVDLLPMVQGGAAAGILETGDRSPAEALSVVVWPWINCRRCPTCRATANQICGSRLRIGIDRPGTLSERAVVPRRNVVSVPSTVGPAEAVAAVDYTDAWRMLADVGEIGRMARVLVAGTGPLADQVAALAEHRHAGVARDGRMAGLTFTHILAIDTPVADLLALLKPSGTLVVRASDPAGSIDPSLLASGRLTVRGSGSGDESDYSNLLAWMTQTGFVPAVGHVVPLDELASGFDGVGRSVLPLIVSVR